MATELVPVLDIRLLSQSDLDALAAASAHAVAPRSCPDADPLPPLKIDRAVFNESAGSRKQTFSRLRLAAANASSSSPSSTTALVTSPSSTTPSAGNDPENHLIAHHLRRLFARDDPSRPPPLSAPPQTQTLALREPSPPPPPRSPSPDPDRETRNSKGVSVDLVRLAGLVDPYGEELRRRTSGMMSESELMGFIGGLGGKWVSQRHRSRFVDADFLGDHLPSGWKLLLGLKRKDRHAWVHCSRYVSPRGLQFTTCREVSVHLMSLLGYPEAVMVPIQHNSPRHSRDDNCHDDAVGFQQQVHSSVDNQNVLPITAVTISSHSGNSNADKEDGNRNPENTYQCQECNLTLHDQSAYAQHQLLFHKKRAKRHRKSKYGEPIVGKDGKFECPVCHKNFEKQSRYFGHVGAHARHEGLTPEAFLDKISSGKAVNYPVGELQFTLQELTKSTEQNVKTASEAGSLHQNYSKEQGLDSSKVRELFSTNCSDSFNRPNEGLCRPEEVTPVTDARSACKYGNDMMDYAAATIPKVAPQSNGELNGRINGFANFSNQAGSYQAIRPTNFASANHHYEDQIVDHSLPSSKHVEFNNTMKARDVNLNSCLDTISFPIAGADNETLTALDGASTTSSCSGSINTSSCSGSINKVSGSLAVSTGPSNAARSIGASYGKDSVANMFGNKNSSMVYPSNMNTRPISPVVTSVDSFASRSEHSKNSDKEHAFNTKERTNITQHRTSNEAAFIVEGYGNDVYTGNITERSLAQFSNNLSHLKHNIPSSCALPESNTLTTGNFTKGTNVNCMNGPFVYRSDANMEGSFVNKSISNNEPKGSAHDVMGKPSNNVQNFYNGSAPNCTPPAANTSQNVNGVVSTQGNFGYMSTVVHSVGDVPRSSTTQDQCDLQLGFGGQKQHLFPGYGELRSAASGSPQLGAMARNNNLPTGSSQFGNMVRPNSLPVGSLDSSTYVQSGSSQMGRMAGPKSIPPAESSQFRRMAGSDTRPPAESSQFWHMSGTNSRPPAESQFGRVAGPNPVPPSESSQFRRMAGPDSGPPAEASQFWHVPVPNSRPPAESSQFGRMAGPNPVPPSESSQSRSMARQNFGRTSEPTLVLGNVPQMGSVPPVQSGWDLNLSRMVSGGGMIAAVCMWCNSQFHHFGPVDGQQQVGNYGVICPSCKDRVSAQRNMPNNGSWQP